MVAGWLAVTLFALYLAALFGLARWGDHALDGGRRRKAVYVLSSCVYCSSWSFCGSIGVASRGGLDFLPLYVGPMLAFSLCHPVLLRIIRLARSQKITSVADFIAARYGKSSGVAAVVTVTATVATIPYIALQIRAVSQSLAIFVDGRLPQPREMTEAASIIAWFVAIALTLLTIAIGARRLDATEHQRGLMLVIAFESIVKLVAFLCVGGFVCWGLFEGINAMTEEVGAHPAIAAIVDKSPDVSMWISMIVTTMASVFLIPRQFHVSVVENRNEGDVRTAGWFVPLYLIALNIFVLPIAIAGLLTFPSHAINRDFTFLALPFSVGNAPVALIGFIGSVAAATSTTLVATTTLAVMVSNDLVMPLLLRQVGTSSRRAEVRAFPILLIRRLAVVVVLFCSLTFSQVLGRADLSTIGLLSLACIVQIAPAALGGLAWERGTARGAMGGTLAGLGVVTYTLLLPAIVARSSPIVMEGPLGLDALRPTDLFGLDIAPFAQGLIWSLGVNIFMYVVVSMTRLANANERVQANIFVKTKSMSLATTFRLRHSTIRVDALLGGVSRYLDPATARRDFVDWHAVRGRSFDGSQEADAPLIHYAERLIASSIGAASSRVVLSLLLQKREMSEAAARQIVDDAAFEIQNSRDVLQHAIDVARDGMAVYDADLRLVAWNRAYRDMFELPYDLMRIGTPIDILVRSNAERGIYGSGSVDDFVASRLEALTQPTDGMRMHSAFHARVYDVRSVRLHNGGLFFTYSDATAQASSEEQLEAENITLEHRVRERTEELERLNVELIRAKAEAEDANISKSRFLAAASHDLLQPLSAARLYMTSLRDRLRLVQGKYDAAQLAANVDESLEALEEILGALLEISHLDAGATKTEIASFCIGDLLRQLQLDFTPLAQERGLRLLVLNSSLRVSSDRKLLRRLLQNLISNAIKYTPAGRVVIGARRRGPHVRVDVYDTGIGIPESKQRIVFREFERLPAAVEASPGAGLGLSIVERLSSVLEHPIALRSTAGRGTLFSVTIPRASSIEEIASRGLQSVPPRQRSLDGLVVAAIDNEQHLLTAIAILLKGWDCMVASGTGLAEIETSLMELDRAPDVIVADYHIGDIDGLAVIAALRKSYGTRPAVLVTADRSPVIRDMAAAADVRVLYKPLKPAALRALLSQWYLVKVAAA